MNKTYNNLKTKQQSFIHMIAESSRVHEVTDQITRGTLRAIAKDNGIEWAPAWLVKDQSRVRGRGLYHVPELNDYRSIMGESDIIADKILGDDITEGENNCDPMSANVMGETV